MRSSPQDALENLFPGMDPAVISLVLEDHNYDVQSAANALLASFEEHRPGPPSSEVASIPFHCNYLDGTFADTAVDPD